MSDSDSILFNVEIENYTGPLDVLLDLAKAQKVNLEDISITKLADQITDFITNEKDIEIMQEFALHNLPTNLELIELNASAENALMKEKLRHAWICKTNLEGKKYWFNSISKKYVLEEPKELENEE